MKLNLKRKINNKSFMKNLVNRAEVYLEPSQTYKMGLLAKTVNSSKRVRQSSEKVKHEL